MGRYSFIASTAAEPAPQERPTRGTRKGAQQVRNASLDVSVLPGSGGYSTVLTETGGGMQEQWTFGNIEGSVKLLVDSGASEHYLDD